jgi:thiol-disulfide isomerase/thioredoxin/uncharacterized membrane protein
MASSLRTRAASALLAILLLAGIAMAVRLVRHHEVQVYGDASEALENCPETETINCEAVNTSAWSEFLGVPIAAFAVPTYLLVLGLALLAPRHESLVPYAFSIGILTTIYSAFLLWVSSMKIGYLCLWCMTLYGINLSIPVLVGVAAWRSPMTHLRRMARDLTTWPRSLRWTAAGFAVLLAGTIAAEQSYRSEVHRRAVEERARIEEQGGPLLPAVPPSSAAPPDEPADGPDDGDHPNDAPRPDAKGGSPSSRLELPWAQATPRGIAVASMLPFDLALGESPAAAATGGSAAAGAPDAGGIYALAGPLRRVSGSRQKIAAEPFDAQGRLGKGKPVALMFWSPGFTESELELVRIAAFIAHETPGIELYAVAGRRADVREEEIWERFSMLDVPHDLPLLLDDGFVVSEALTTTDVPNLALFDAKGALVVAKIKDLSQWLMSASGRVRADDVVRKVAAGAHVDQIRQMYPYYPAADLLGRRAPAFTARKFDTKENYAFSGRSAASKPTLVMFWSSTCTHCQQEIPQMVAWMKTHPGVIDVVSVTHLKRKDGSDAVHRKQTENYIRTQGIPWTVLEDPDGAINDLYRSISTPTTFVVSPSSCVAEIWYYAHPEGGFPAALEKALAKAGSAKECAPAPPVEAARLGFSMMDGGGKRLDLASLLDRPSLVHFWATWCVPCREELPSLVQFRDRVEKDGAARVLLVSVEGEEAGGKIAEYQKSIGLDLRSYRAPAGGLADRIDLSYRVPRTYLVAPGGEVLALREGGQKWDDPDLVERVRSRLDVLGHAQSIAAVKGGAGATHEATPSPAKSAP